MLTECGSHATIGLHLGDYNEAEIHGAYAHLPRLSQGMFLLHDANFIGGAYLEALNAKGVRSLFALASTVAVQRMHNLPDGSALPHEKSAFVIFSKPPSLEVVSHSAPRSFLCSCSFAQRNGSCYDASTSADFT
jgi:hypothetical protein